MNWEEFVCHDRCLFYLRSREPVTREEETDITVAAMTTKSPKSTLLLPVGTSGILSVDHAHRVGVDTLKTILAFGRKAASLTPRPPPLE
jgi:hypothetical protein